MAWVNLGSSEILSVLLTTEVKGALLLGVALLGAAALRRGPAAARHRVLLLGIFGLLVLPVAGIIAPGWSVPAPRWAEAITERSLAVSPAIAERELTSSAGAGVAPAAPAPSEVSVTPVVRVAPVAQESLAAPLFAPAQWITLGTLLLAVWGLGTVLLLSRLWASIRSLAVFSRRSAPFPPGRVTTLADEMRRLLGIRRRVTILEGEAGVMPMSWGIVRPVILLPSDAERWHRSRLVSVLVHELEHVRRADCATQITAEAIAAIHWPNPLAWLITSRLRLEREHACDDAVVAMGARPSQYAEELLSLARGSQPAAGRALAAVAMARPTHLTARLRAVLEERTSRVLSRGAAGFIGIAASVVVLGVAGADAAPAAPSEVSEALATPFAVDMYALPVRSAADEAAARDEASDVEPTTARVTTVLPSEALQLAETSPAEDLSSLPEEEPSRQLIPSGFTAFVSRFLPIRPLRSAPALSSRQQPTCGMSNEGWRNTRIDSDDFDHRLTWSRPGCEVDVRIEGDVQFTADFRDVARLAPGAFVRIEEEDGGSTLLSGDDSPDRRLDITAGAGGAPVYEYRVNGDVRPFDAAARAWYEAMLLQIFRRAGLMAEERVGALLRSGGVPAVLQEIEFLTADHVFAAYVRQLLAQADLSETQAVQVVEGAAERLESDHYMAEVLQAVVDRHLASNAVLAAFLAASRTVESDHYRAGVLELALQRSDLPAGHVSALLESATGIGSDHYLAEVLEAMSTRYALEPGVRENYLLATESIESDHYRAGVLSSLLARSDLSAAELAVALRSARGIASDHYVTEVLQQMAERDVSSSELLDAYLDVAGSIESDHYRSEALQSLLARETVPDPQLQSVIRAAAGIASDHYKSDVLLDIVRRFRLEGASRAAFMEAMSSIGSGHYRGQVADALLRRQPGA